MCHGGVDLTSCVVLLLMLTVHCVLQHGNGTQYLMIRAVGVVRFLTAKKIRRSNGLDC